MQLNQAIDLIRHEALNGPEQAIWADLGCGSGLFTFALAHLLPAGSTIYAIDRDPALLQPHSNPRCQQIIPRQLDFIEQKLDLSGLHGILMANSLHYVADQPALLQKLKKCLAPEGYFLIVEYDTDLSNPWVPHPIRYLGLERLFRQAGFTVVQKLREMPSLYGRANLYAALAHQP